jgi:hypothetical protein
METQVGERRFEWGGGGRGGYTLDNWLRESSWYRRRRATEAAARTPLPQAEVARRAAEGTARLLHRAQENVNAGKCTGGHRRNSERHYGGTQTFGTGELQHSSWQKLAAMGSK